ncbi:MAG TPA: hypothetical protein VG055_30255 [Planctomycetaceae bacterium]|jgi:hypothetical protein|nr:hypothetical protein [Planctomycetaceae bacterium]
MGIRLRIFAVDLNRFDPVLDDTLEDWLWRHQRTARPSEPLSALRWYDGKTNDNYGSIQSKDVTWSYTDNVGRRVTRKLTKTKAQDVPFLQQTVRSFLNGGSAYDLYFFLRALSECDASEFVHCITDGGRRWWIGCVLCQARKVLCTEDYQRLELLFRKVLRGYNCGDPIPMDDVGVDLSGFPVTPEPDSDLRIGFWTRSEALCAGERTRDLLAADVRFSRPPASPDMYPSDEDCDAWARSELEGLTQLNDQCDNVVALTFIG